MKRLMMVMMATWLWVGCSADGGAGLSETTSVIRSQTTIRDDLEVDGTLVVGDHAIVVAGLDVVGGFAGQNDVSVDGKITSSGDIVAGGVLRHAGIMTLTRPGAAWTDPARAHSALLSQYGAAIGLRLAPFSIAPVTMEIGLSVGDVIRDFRVYVDKRTSSSCWMSAQMARVDNTMDEQPIAGSGVSVNFSVGDGVMEPSGMTAAPIERGWQYYVEVWPCGGVGDRLFQLEVDYNRPTQ